MVQWLGLCASKRALIAFFSPFRRLGAELGKSVVYQETNGGELNFSNVLCPSGSV